MLAVLEHMKEWVTFMRCSYTASVHDSDQFPTFLFLFTAATKQHHNSCMCGGIALAMYVSASIAL